MRTYLKKLFGKQAIDNFSMIFYETLLFGNTKGAVDNILPDERAGNRGAN